MFKLNEMLQVRVAWALNTPFNNQKRKMRRERETNKNRSTLGRSLTLYYLFLARKKEDENKERNHCHHRSRSQHKQNRPKPNIRRSKTILQKKRKKVFAIRNEKSSRCINVGPCVMCRSKARNARSRRKQIRNCLADTSRRRSNDRVTQVLDVVQQIMLRFILKIISFCFCWYFCVISFSFELHTITTDRV